MGKGGSAKVEVTYYYLSIHYGISVPVDKLLALTIKEKPAWSGEVSTLTDFDINQRELFGGDTKEGGLIGRVTFLPGAPGQVLPDHLAVRQGRANGADCVGYRGISSIYFHREAAETQGFYWGANNPFVPGCWATVQRAPVGLDPSLALIFSGSRTPRAICFCLDRSTSMAGAKLATMKSAMTTVLDLVKASVQSGVQIDLSVTSWSTGSSTITRRGADEDDVDDVIAFVNAISTSNGTDFNAGMDAAETFFNATDGAIADRFLFFVTDGEPAPSTTSAAEAGATLATLTGVDSYGINIVLENTEYTELVDNTPSDGVPVVSGDDPSGLVNAVINALFGDDVRGDANPAHIIYECLTNAAWGMGSPPAAIDYQSFHECSATLYAENFGLSMLWTRQTSIEAFVQEVLDHIQGVLFVEPSNGLLTLALIRGDYDAEALPELTPDNADLTSFSRKLWGEIVNEIAVTWTNPENEQEETVTAHDIASIAMQGGVVADSRNYYGVRNADLAQALAWRDLRSAGQPLASCDAEVDRTQWQLRPASVVKLTWPEYGISEIVMRVISVDYGRPGDATIKLSLIEDVFGLDIGSYESPPSTEWEDPSSEPEPMEFVEILTLPLFFARVSAVAEFIDTPEYPEVVAGVLASTSSSDTYEYQLWDEVALTTGDPEWQNTGTNNIIGRALLAADLDAEATSSVVSFTGRIGNTSPVLGGFAIIGNEGEAGNEIALITAAGATYDLKRGTLDTVPRAWPAGTPVWFVDDSTLFEDRIVRSAAEVVDYKLLTRTSLGVLDIDAAPLEDGPLTERPWLPNRPANVTAAGEAWTDPAAPFDVIDRVDPWVTVTWSIRNRLDEDAVVLGWIDASGTPEDGQTTKIEVRDLDGDLLATHDGLTGTTFDVPDASFASAPFVELRVFSERSDADGDFVSLQYFSHWLHVAPLTADSTVVTADSTTWTADEG